MGFKVPTTLETKRFRLRMLTVRDVEKDYDAVMSSRVSIYGVFGPGDDWPAKGLTLEQDLIDLGWHQKEFQKRGSFAYTVMSLNGKQCLGCVYLYSSAKKSFDAEVYLWVRKSESKTGLDAYLFETIKFWIDKNWPFDRVAYPGREIPWKAWQRTK